MRRRTVNLLWGTSVILAACALALVRGGTAVRAAAAAPPRGPATVMMFDEDAFATLASHVVEQDPFRLDRKPAAVPFGTPDVPVPPPGAIVRPFQSLALKGIVGGPPWQAILAGVPNRQGNVVARVGDTLAGVRVVRVRADGVVLKGTGMDTLITLTFNRTWQ